jgi:hypothetical protein
VFEISLGEAAPKGVTVPGACGSLASWQIKVIFVIMKGGSLLARH